MTTYQRFAFSIWDAALALGWMPFSKETPLTVENRETAQMISYRRGDERLWFAGHGQWRYGRELTPNATLVQLTNIQQEDITAFLNGEPVGLLDWEDADQASWVEHARGMFDNLPPTEAFRVAREHYYRHNGKLPQAV